MLWEYTIVQEAFESILENKKVVEIRSKKKNIKQGDYIRFHDLNSNRYIHVIVDHVESYDSIDELLERVDKNLWEFIPKKMCHKFIHEQFCENKAINTVMAIFFHLPKVSIIMPGYNAMPYLVETLNSIATQSYKDYEIIYLDDNSNDDTDYAIEDLKSDLPIRYLKHYIHKGAANLRTEGLKQSFGDYVIFLDSDDLLENNMLLCMVHTLENSDADIALVEYDSFVSANGYSQNTISYFNNDFILNSMRKNVEWKNIPLYLLHWTNVPWNKMYKKSFLINIKAEFQNISCSNDVYFSHFTLCKGLLRHVNTNDALIHYRTNKSNSISSKHDYFSEIQAYQKIFFALDDIDNITKTKLYDDFIFGVMKYIRIGNGEKHKEFFDAIKEDILIKNNFFSKEYLEERHPLLVLMFKNYNYDSSVFKLNYLVIYLIEMNYSEIERKISMCLANETVGILKMSNELRYFIKRFNIENVNWIIGEACRTEIPKIFFCLTPLQYGKVENLKMKLNLINIKTVTLFEI